MEFAFDGGARAGAPFQYPALDPSALARASDALEQWRHASLSRRELVVPGDQQLSDLGLSRSQLGWMVPIRSLESSQRPHIARHLLALDAGDRYLRFGYAATDEHIRRYVDEIDFERDQMFGIFNRRLELLAMAHLAQAGVDGCDSCLEFGLSVARQARGRGWGTRLLERATNHARNRGVKRLLLRALSENTAVLKIARHAGAIVNTRGAEAEAWLPLPAPTVESHLAEMMCQSYGETDYRIKEQAVRLTDLVLGVGARSGERAA